MSRSRTVWCSFFAVCLSVCILNGFAVDNAGATAPRDFATGRPLSIDGGAALGTYTLPLEVLAAVKGDVSRIAVFNAAGNVVPYAFRVPAAEHATTLTQTLPLFPVHEAELRPAVGATVEVTIQKDGTLARVQLSEPITASTANPRHLERYLVDASAAKGAIEELSFVVRPNEGAGADYTWTVHVAAGDSIDNLNHVIVHVAAGDSIDNLNHVIHSGTLARLTHQGTSLSVASLTTPGLTAPYLALTWEGKAPGTIERIDAKVASEKQGVTPKATELTASRLALSDPASKSNSSPPRHALVYDARAELPLRSLHWTLPEVNTLAKVDVYVSSEPPGVAAMGALVFSGNVYRLSHNGATLESSPVELNRTARYVTLTTNQAASEAQLGLNTDNVARWPRLVLTYAPTQLLFVATGEAPFTLAYGTYIPSQALAPSEILAVTASFNAARGERDNVTAGEAIALGTPAPPQEAWPWKRVGLWAVLVVGVAVLALMTRGLLRRLRELPHQKG